MNECFCQLKIEDTTPECKKWLQETERFDFEEIMPLPYYSHAQAKKVWGCSGGLTCGSEESVMNVLRAGEEACFSTPWAPPSNLIKALSASFPGTVFELKYDEPGNKLFGLEIWENGELQPGSCHR